MQEQDIFGVRSVRFRVDQTTQGLRLARCVAGKVQGLSVRGAKEIIDRGWVFVNNRRITKASRPAQEGDWVEVYLHERSGATHLRQEDILWEGKSLIAVNKPPGLLVYGTRGVTDDTVIPQLEGWLRDTGGWRPGRDSLQLVHRLDRDTSGVLLLARSARVAAELEAQFRRQEVDKSYLVLAQGRPRNERFRQESPVRPKRPDHGPTVHETGRVAAPTRKGSQEPKGVTEFEVLETFPRCILLKARPLTGRTHQIRVHLAQLGHPVLGDILYGPERSDEPLFRAIPRQMLHASFLAVRDPYRGERLEFTAPLAEDMKQVLDWLRKRENRKSPLPGCTGGVRNEKGSGH